METFGSNYVLHLGGEPCQEQCLIEPIGEGEVKRAIEFVWVVRRTREQGLEDLDVDDVVKTEATESHDLVVGAS